MPIRSHDVFADIVSQIDPDKNPFVRKFIDAHATGALPIACGPALKECPGHWREKFKHIEGYETKPLVVEIGCHTGRTLSQMAAAHPELLFLGIDITFKRVIHTAERAHKLGLNNVFTILANAGGLEELFDPGEVDGFVTFFPDPWSKKKHAHNRLYAPKFCKASWAALRPGGFLWLKTDHEVYFNDACSHVADQGFHASDVLPLFGSEDFSSTFMARFELVGQPWFGRKWIKPLH